MKSQRLLSYLNSFVNIKEGNDCLVLKHVEFKIPPSLVVNKKVTYYLIHCSTKFIVLGMITDTQYISSTM
jgi:hypothetical protein